MFSNVIVEFFDLVNEIFDFWIIWCDEIVIDCCVVVCEIVGQCERFVEFSDYVVWLVQVVGGCLFWQRWVFEGVFS